MSPRLYAFDAPLPDGPPAEIVGGKGASLRRMTELGLDVPPGFTITIAAIQERQRSAIDWSDLWVEIEPALRELGRKSGRSWGVGPRPLTVAVRSGAADSHPGRMRTLLHCGWTELLAAQSGNDDAWRQFAAFLDTVARSSQRPTVDAPPGLDATKSQTPTAWRARCRQLLNLIQGQRGPVADDPSLWLRMAVEIVAESARVVPDQPLATAVTIQLMISADVSGVLRSRDPRDLDGGSVLIEAVPGDGEALMAGDRTPVVVSLPRPRSKDTSGRSTPGADAGGIGNGGVPTHPGRSDPPILPPALPRKLYTAALQLEAAVGEPVEVEWVLGGERLVFLQYRCPHDDDPAAALIAREVTRLRDLAGRAQRYWVRHQLAESLPLPTTLSWSLWDQFVSPTGGLGTLYRRLGFAPAPFPNGAGCLQRLAGRIYVDPDRWVQLLCRGFPWRHAIDQLQASPEHLQEPPDHFDPQRLDPWFLLTWPHLMWVLLRSRRRRRHLERTAAEEFTSSVLRAFDTQFALLSTPNVQATDLPSRLRFAGQVRHWLFDEQLPRLLLPGWLGIQAWREVAREVALSSSAEAGARLLSELLPRLETGPVPRSDVDPDGFGPAGMGLWDAMSLELSELPAAEDHANAESGRTEAASDALTSTSRLPPVAGDASHLPRELFGQLSPAGIQSLQTSCQLLPLRNVGRRRFLAGYLLFARLLRQLAEQTGLGDLLYCLSWSELRQWGHAPLDRQLLQQRQREREVWRRISPPALLRGDAPRPFQPPVEMVSPGSGESWAVTSVSTGQSQGPVWRPTVAGQDCPAGVIVVTESLSPSDLWRWRNAAGFLVERGGLLSHAAVTARQLRLPLAIQPHATRLFRTGENLQLDATNGSVQRHGRDSV